MVNQGLTKNMGKMPPDTPPPTPLRTIYLSLPLYAIVHINHFEVLHDMVNQGLTKNMGEMPPDTPHSIAHHLSVTSVVCHCPH